MPNANLQKTPLPFVPDPRGRLKAITDNVHQSLHVHPVSLAILNDGCAVALHVFLRAQLSLLRHVEQVTPPAFQPDFDALKMALVDDIGGPQDADPVTVQGRAARAGTTYVVLGSLMGRKTLLSSIRRTSASGEAPRYLTCPMPVGWWRWVLTELDDLAHDETAWAAVEAAALDAFGHIACGLDSDLK